VSLYPVSVSALRSPPGPVTRRRVTRATRRVTRAIAATRRPPPIGSAAADWSRWPMGTTFRLLSTGQIYRVEDYGWALSGRNTIDLYMVKQRNMNTWAESQEPIKILRWGEPQTRLQFQQSQPDYHQVNQ